MGNNDEIKERLRKVLEVKNMSVSKITEGEDVKRSTLSAQINGNSAVSADTLRLFLRKFADLSADWLVRGIGSMFCCPTSDIDTLYNTQGDNSNNVQVVGKADDAILALKDKEIQMLEDQVKFLKEQVEFYKSKKDA